MDINKGSNLFKYNCRNVRQLIKPRPDYISVYDTSL